MPKPENKDKLYSVRVSTDYKKPTINGQKPRDRKGNPLPIMVLVAFANDAKLKKDFPFYGDEEQIMSEEEYRSACFLKVPHNINPNGVVPNPHVIVKEVS